jgi:hypothetical protein
VAHKSHRAKDTFPALVCRGPHCRGRAQERLCDELCAAGTDVIIVGCLGVCRGPVAILSIGDRWEVVSRVRDREARGRLVKALIRQRAKAIRKRIVRGSRGRKAIEKGMRKLGRRSPAVRRFAPVR